MKTEISRENLFLLGIGVVGTMIIAIVIIRVGIVRAAKQQNLNNPELSNVTTRGNPEIPEFSTVIHLVPPTSEPSIKFSIPEEIQYKVTMDSPNIYHFNQECTIQASNNITYFEVMLLSIPASSFLMGFAPECSSSTKPETIDSSIILDIIKGIVYLQGQAIEWVTLGECERGDLMSCSITKSGSFNSSIQFARNGVWSPPLLLPLLASNPTLHATGECQVQVLLNNHDFVYRSSCPSSHSLPPSYPGLPTYQ